MSATEFDFTGRHRSEFVCGADSWPLEKFRREGFRRSVASCGQRLPCRFDGEQSADRRFAARRSIVACEKSPLVATAFQRWQISQRQSTNCSSRGCRMTARSWRVLRCGRRAGPGASTLSSGDARVASSGRWTKRGDAGLAATELSNGARRLRVSFGHAKRQRGDASPVLAGA